MGIFKLKCMKKLCVLLLGLCATAACTEVEEQIAPVNDGFETPETRIVVPTVPESHKSYIREIFRKGLPSSVTDAQVDDVVEGYLEEYVHHSGIGYITEDFHKHFLCPGTMWPGPNEEYALKARTYFTDNFKLFFSTKNFRYLGKALHPIYDAYDENMNRSCAASTPASTIISNWGEWFGNSALRDKHPAGYSLVGRRTSAISWVYSKINNQMIPGVDAPRIFNVWITNLINYKFTPEPCVPSNYVN